jgi:hypothetical protein
LLLVANNLLAVAFQLGILGCIKGLVVETLHYIDNCFFIFLEAMLAGKKAMVGVVLELERVVEILQAVLLLLII